MGEPGKAPMRAGAALENEGRAVQSQARPSFLRAGAASFCGGEFLEAPFRKWPLWNKTLFGRNGQLLFQFFEQGQCRWQDEFATALQKAGAAQTHRVHDAIKL